MEKDAKEKKSYKSAFKATSLFGGVQIFNILIGIVRSKFIAILLGPTGMGIAGLFTSTLTLLSSLTNCGLSTSAVRNIADANSEKDTQKVSYVIKTFRRLIWFTGVVGSLICLIFARPLSNFTFGKDDYTTAFRILSVTILIMQLTAGQNALLQGLRKYKDLALANVIGHGIALLVTVPMYYIWDLSAIVPAIIIMYVITFFIAYYFARKVHVNKESIPKSIFLQEGGNMIKMGIFISLQGILSLLAGYIIKIYIQSENGVGEVGLYTADFTIINTDVGMVFTAMSTDFYPRLSGVASDNGAMNKMINQQMEIALLILSPIIALFFVFAKLGIRILYSEDFFGIENMLYFAILGIIFKAISWAVAFSFLAKGDTKSFFLNESSTILYSLTLNIIFYRILGLTGLGISYLINYIIYMFQVLFVCRLKYSYQIEKKMVGYILCAILMLSTVVLVKLHTSHLVGLLVSISVVLALSFISIRRLDYLLDLRTVIKSKLGKQNTVND